MLTVLGDPTDDEYESFIKWLPDGYDPEAFSVECANHGIRELQSGRGYAVSSGTPVAYR